MRLLLTFLLLALALPAHAGIRAVYDERAPRRTLVFEIADNGDFRAGSPGGAYRLALGEDMYEVALLDGQPVVARLDDIEQALRAASSSGWRGAMRGLSLLAAGPRTIARQGRKRIGAWEGRVYRVAGPNDGEQDEADFYVISADPALRPVGDAVARFTAGELAFGRHLLADRTAASMLELVDRLAALGTILQANDGGMRLREAGKADIDPARLALPAAPLSREEVEALIRAGRSPFRAHGER